MKKILFCLAITVSMFGCGGGSDAPPKDNPTGSAGNASTISKLSADQTVFENFFLAQNGGAFNIYFPRTWTKLETDWIKGESTQEYISKSPVGDNPILLEQITKKFGVDTSRPNPIQNRYGFYLHNGQIIKSKWKDYSYREIWHAMYSGAKIQLVMLATDNTTIVDSMDLEQFKSKPLEGFLINASSELFNASFDPRPFLQLKDKNASFLPNAQYIEYSRRQSKDVYMIEECQYDEPNIYFPNACNTRTGDLNTELSKGIDVRGNIYSINEGNFSTFDGHKIWITSKYTSRLPYSEFFIEKNNRIYLGTLFKKDTIYGVTRSLNDAAEKSFRLALTK